MLKVCPATVIVASRADPVFASTLNCTVPLPDPLAPAVMCTHDCDADAVHAQPAPPVTAIDPDPPPESNVWLVGLIPIEHPPD